MFQYKMKHWGVCPQCFNKRTQLLSGNYVGLFGDRLMTYNMIQYTFRQRMFIYSMPFSKFKLLKNKKQMIIPSLQDYF